MRELFDEAANRSNSNPMQAAQRAARAVQRKRFYQDTGVGEADGGFTVTLDGKAIKTPSGRTVIVPVRSLAETIAAEWNAQGEVIDPTTMPATRFANSVAQGVTDNAQAVADDVAKYFGSDLLFYRAGHPEGLVAREAEHWDPILFWAAETLGAHFMLAEGGMHVRQPDPAIAAACGALPDDPWAIAAVHVITTVTGSALLALALSHRVIDPDQAWAAAHVDEDWNAEQWGVDEEAAARKAAKLVDFNAATGVLKALHQGA
ncbi:ATP12 family protein [Bradyrhizobium sp.]|uniref:ATP12 family chaperone protein n=1 Tax=Bradyrhizobium sp. TaxID=376 RepID=UPI00261F116E|nr:ATP12 family protein [Bradyrhizobium sp.]